MTVYCVRRRPALKPPMPEANNCVIVAQIMAAMPIEVALTPALTQGDTDEKPSPVPGTSKFRESAAAAAPATIALHETALGVAGS